VSRSLSNRRRHRNECGDVPPNKPLHLTVRRASLRSARRPAGEWQVVGRAGVVPRKARRKALTRPLVREGRERRERRDGAARDTRRFEQSAPTVEGEEDPRVRMTAAVCSLGTDRGPHAGRLDRAVTRCAAVLCAGAVRSGVVHQRFAVTSGTHESSRSQSFAQVRRARTPSRRPRGPPAGSAAPRAKPLAFPSMEGADHV